jgi:hypothetical protein
LVVKMLAVDIGPKGVSTTGAPATVFVEMSRSCGAVGSGAADGDADGVAPGETAAEGDADGVALRVPVGDGEADALAEGDGVALAFVDALGRGVGRVDAAGDGEGASGTRTRPDTTALPGRKPSRVVRTVTSPGAPSGSPVTTSTPSRSMDPAAPSTAQRNAES